MRRLARFATLATAIAGLMLYGCGAEETSGPMGSPAFTEVEGLNLTGVTASSLAWGDFDNDGDLDLAIAGRDPSLVLTTKVYENDGAGGLSEVPGLTLAGVWSCSLAWGDCDNDGDLDLAVAGLADGGSTVTVYENKGESTIRRDRACQRLDRGGQLLPCLR